LIVSDDKAPSNPPIPPPEPRLPDPGIPERLIDPPKPTKTMR